MLKLSVAIITYNEEAKIAACIESIKQIADEVVVVDSFSTDKTVEISKSMGAVTVSNAFTGYAQQKNQAMAMCTHGYILSLDADERLDEEALQHVLALKKHGFKHDGYALKRITFIGDQPIKHGSWYPDKKIRLIKKGMGFWEGKGVHETLNLQSTNTYTLQGNILHFSYKNVEELFEKTKKYANLAAEHLHAQHKKISPLFIPIKATARFIKHYFIKGGFLSGRLGWQIGKQQYFEALWKYKFLNSLNQKAKGKK